MEAPPAGYRKNVGICLINSSKKIFSASRLDIPDSWQMPQGGVDEGEDPRDAAIRELMEETGVSSAEILAEVWDPWKSMTKRKTKRVLYNLPQVPYWLTYDFPPEVREKLNKQLGTDWKGQAQKWVILLVGKSILLLGIKFVSLKRLEVWAFFILMLSVLRITVLLSGENSSPLQPSAAIVTGCHHPPPAAVKREGALGTVKRDIKCRFCFRFVGREEEINLSWNGTEKPEFGEWSWMTPKQVIELAVGFKKPVYEEVLKYFAPYLL
ncbi:nudix hydrolase 26, chloroplastic isoform X2 [Dendrobium catenatum]|uniref:nudix hydrolase 26, chloroplastic isoform X2 n=1 Tax=Dendrobium catenatum TaxID=906689 RepID=UPI0010A04A5A|nr:nudix hydrolase 26, chloroplastic isoform X2 [Dendrobium catenatum]